MELARDVTRQDIRDIVESALGSSDFLNEVARAGCDVQCKVSQNYTPYLEVNTNDSQFVVTVETRDLYTEDDEHIGWEFIPTIITEGLRMELEYGGGDATAQFERWYDIAKFVKRIADVEVYPMDYLD